MKNRTRLSHREEVFFALMFTLAMFAFARYMLSPIVVWMSGA